MKQGDIHQAPTFKEFAVDTTIHGIRDAVSSRNAFSKSVWILLLCFSTTAAAFGIYQTVRGYLDRPLATQVKQLMLDTYPYPAITFCPQSWINASRAVQLNLSKDDLAYGISYMPMFQLQHQLENQTDTAVRFVKIMNESGLRSLFDFYKFIAFDSDRILNCHRCVTWPAKKKVIEKGVCYQLEFKEVRRYHLDDFLHPAYFQYSQVITDQKSIIPNYTSFTSTDRLYIGLEPNDFFQFYTDKLKANSSYLVKIVPSQLKRLHGKGKASCISQEEYRRRNISLEMCYADCEQQVFGPACWGFVHFGYFFGSAIIDTNNRPVPLWSSFTHDSIDPSTWTKCEAEQRKKYEKCAQDCLPKCEEWLYDTTIIEVYKRRLVAHTNEADITVVFNYQVRSSAYLMEEKATYTWDTCLSDVGGQMELWLGGSVLSICQLVFFLFRWVEYRLQVRAKKAIEKRHAAGST